MSFSSHSACSHINAIAKRVLFSTASQFDLTHPGEQHDVRGRLDEHLFSGEAEKYGLLLGREPLSDLAVLGLRERGRVETAV